MTHYIHGSEHALKFPLQEMAEKWCTQQNSNLRPLPSENTRTTRFSRFCSLFTVNKRGSKRATRGYCYPKSWGQWARENLFKRRLTERNDHGSK